MKAKVLGQIREITKSGNRYYYWSARLGRRMPIAKDKIEWVEA